MWILTLLYWGAICVATHMPHVPADTPQVNDKVMHFMAYGLLTGLFFLSLWTLGVRPRLSVLLTLLIVLVYGVIDERTQPYFGRTCDLIDWLADAAGTTVSLLAMSLLRWLASRWAAPAPAPAS